MKLISWNVNGLRACVQKGFLDYFHAADADFFCIQESKDRSHLICRATTSTGITPRKKATPARQSLQNTNLFRSHAASAPQSAIPKAG